MESKHNVRNISAVGELGHGKSTLLDTLTTAEGGAPIKQAQEQPPEGKFKDELGTSMTVKSAGISLFYEKTNEALSSYPGERDGKAYLVNLVDTPGHVELSAEVTTALRPTDGALVVIDCIEGASTQTETILRQALAERIRLVITLNKLDRCFLELNLDSEQTYAAFLSVIQSANTVLATFAVEQMGDVSILPQKGNVCFSSGLHGWAFTLTTFAKIYTTKFGVEEAKMTERLWGDHFFDPVTKEWTKRRTQSATCKRGFAMFIYEPLEHLMKACMSEDKKKARAMARRLGIVDKLEGHTNLQPKLFMKHFMQTWLPAHEALLEMMIHQLPSPVTAQSYRVDSLYRGPLNGIYATGIRDCDPDGPLIVYVSKMIPSDQKGKFLAFGRVFSGKIKTGRKVHVVASMSEWSDTWRRIPTGTVEQTFLQMGKSLKAVEEVECGNMVALSGLDSYISKAVTLMDEENTEMHPFRDMRFASCPIFRLGVQPKDPADNPQLLKGLRLLSKSDPVAECYQEESGESIVSGSGELHLQLLLRSLQEDYMDGADIEVSDPIVALRETVLHESDHTCLAKSPNKHNRLYMRAKPMTPSLIEAIEEGRVHATDDPRARAEYLSHAFGWKKEYSSRIWAFGPHDAGPNLLIDVTRGVQYLNEKRDFINRAFQWVSQEGVLCEENLRGVIFELEEVVCYSDAMHRGGGQVIPACRRCMYASQLTAGPRLMEPIYNIEIQTPHQDLAQVCALIHQRRGTVCSSLDHQLLPVERVHASVPAMECFGLTPALRGVARGASCQMLFSHWETLQEDPLIPGCYPNALCTKTRLRKGLQPEPQPLSSVEDRL